LCHAKLYYVNKKYLLLYAHIISRVETIISIFYLQFEGENKLNSIILVNLLRKIYVSKILVETIITIFYLQIYEFAYCLFDKMIHITTMAYIYVQMVITRHDIN
jgi:hypothetical protein